MVWISGYIPKRTYIANAGKSHKSPDHCLGSTLCLREAILLENERRDTGLGFVRGWGADGLHSGASSLIQRSHRSPSATFADVVGLHCRSELNRRCHIGNEELRLGNESVDSDGSGGILHKLNESVLTADLFEDA